jgi:hypothetical protein
MLLPPLLLIKKKEINKINNIRMVKTIKILNKSNNKKKVPSWLKALRAKLSEMVWQHQKPSNNPTTKKNLKFNTMQPSFLTPVTPISTPQSISKPPAPQKTN